MNSLHATIISLALAHFAIAAPAPTSPLKDVQAIGDVAVDKDTVTVKAATAILILGASDADTYRLTAEIKLPEKAGGPTFLVMPADVNDPEKYAVLKGYFFRDLPGLSLGTSTYLWDGGIAKWIGKPDALNYVYWPAPTHKAGLAQLEGSGIIPRSLKDRWLRFRIDAEKHRVAFYLDGLLVRQLDRAAGTRGPVVLNLQQDQMLRNVQLTPLDADPNFVPVDLTPFAQEPLPQPIGKTHVSMEGIPFELANGGKSQVNLRRAGWIEAKTDPADYYENYENGPPIVHDPRMPLLRVPLGDYLGAHILAIADDDPATTNHLTLRAGRYGYADQVYFHSYRGEVARKSEIAKVPAHRQLATPAGTLVHAYVRMTGAIAQDLKRFLEIELTKEIRLARRQPDPCRFRSRPLGLPSGVRIAAITLERAPLQMQVTSRETGHAFVQPQQPTFQVRLQNLTEQNRPFEITVNARHLDGTPTSVTQPGHVGPHQTVELEIALPRAKLGYHDLTVTLSDAFGRVQLQRETSFALLPPDTRKHRASSPFGTWDFCGGHFTPDDPDITGPLYVKLGLRWGMFSFKPEKRQHYGILAGNEPNIFQSGVKGWEDFLKNTPDQPPIALLFHETAVSGKHLTRIPEIFSDLPPYKLDAEEQKTFKNIHDAALKTAKEMRAKHPKVHLRLGNGPLPTKEVMYQAKFPAELFDSAGNEAGSFGRMPEAQPPDCVALNSSLWMDRQMLDHYGYKNKPVSLCLEVCYPASSPGNVSLTTQADYHVRLALHALAWGIPEIKIGQICDMGNGYYYSNWGAIGFVRSKPELNVKPSFVTFATMTRVLDGARFVRVVPMGSQSLYGLEFTRPDGSQAHAFWTIRGQRTLKLTLDQPGPWTQIDGQGAETAVNASNGAVELTASPTPIYLVGKGKITKVEPGATRYADKPPARHAVIDSLANLDNWTVEPNRDPELEYYDFMCPRRKGEFAFSPVASFEGGEKVLKVTPRPIKHGKDTMPMYAALAHKKGMTLASTPTEIGLWINGNSGWGRPIFELTDASGQRWISLGAQQDGVPRKWLEDLVPADQLAKWSKPGINDWNTGDVFGTSRINFDGWRYLAFPAPGNYPGEKFPWPANSQWRWDKDGVVHYPLTFKRLILELPEKVLHMKTFAPPSRPEIYLKDLTAGQDDKQLGFVPGDDR